MPGLRAEMLRAVNDGFIISEPAAIAWLSRRTMDDLPDLAWLMTQHSELLDEPGQVAFARELINDLHVVVEHGHEELSQYDALCYVAQIFQLLWNKPSASEVLFTIKSRLEEMLLGWPEKGIDLVILVILEHLFVDSDKRRFFSAWGENDNLYQAYDEAVRLSAG